MRKILIVLAITMGIQTVSFNCINGNGKELVNYARNNLELNYFKL